MRYSRAMSKLRQKKSIKCKIHPYDSTNDGLNRMASATTISATCAVKMRPCLTKNGATKSSGIWLQLQALLRAGLRVREGRRDGISLAFDCGLCELGPAFPAAFGLCFGSPWLHTRVRVWAVSGVGRQGRTRGERRAAQRVPRASMGAPQSGTRGGAGGREGGGEWGVGYQVHGLELAAAITERRETLDLDHLVP